MSAALSPLAPSFTLEEMPCYAHASAADVAKLTQTAVYVLQPVRDVFGPVVVSSWKWWQSGCVQRTGPHSGGGTVDFVVPGADLKQVFAWGVFHLPRNYFGRWIYEPAIPGVQGEHIHVSPRTDMEAVDGITDSAAYVETGVGVYTPVQGWSGNSGTETKVSVEGVSVNASGSLAPPWAAGAIALVLGLSIYHWLGGDK